MRNLNRMRDILFLFYIYLLFFCENITRGEIYLREQYPMHEIFFFILLN